jgi:hypothetical protein
MRHPARTPALLAAAALALAACKEKAPAEPRQPGPQGGSKPFAFTLRDLALATAVDASLARLSLAGSDVEAALLSTDPRERAKAQDLVPALDAALADAGQAVKAVTNGLDRPAAAKVGATAKEYADRLGAAAGAPTAPLTPELAAARAAFGEALTAYRQSRVAWRIDAPAPEGAERDFAEARRSMETAETGFMSRTRVAPREEGHEFDAAAVRMTGQMGVQRAKEAAAQLPPGLKPHAVRYAAAQERVLEAVNAIQGASEADRPRLARGYHAAKAEALAALADYFAALAAR